MQPQGRSPAAFDLVTMGEILMDLLATARDVSLFDAPAFEPRPGGAPANVAVGARRLGARVAFLGKVGRDDFGRGLRDLLAREGVETRGLREDGDAMTTLAFVSRSDAGEPSFAFYAGAHTRLTPDELDAELLQNTRILHIGSVSLAHAPVRAATLAAARLARAAGAVVSYDVNWRPALWPDAHAALDALRAPLPQVDILKVNASELALLAGVEEASEDPTEDPEALLARLDAPCPLVVVTLGGRGCLARWGGGLYAQEPPAGARGAPMVDATGAGDAFVAGLLTGLPTPLDALTPAALRAALQRATLCGARAVTRVGAMAALPFADELGGGAAADA